MTQNSTLQALIDGYRKFKQKHFEENDLYKTLVEEGQKPKVLTIACSDSRVDPAIVLGCNPGDIFTVRNVANLVPPYKVDPKHHGTSAALEFGIKGLNVTDILIFGHSYCGGIKALMQGKTGPQFDFINTWMDIAKPAKDNVVENFNELSFDDQCHECEKESLVISLDNLKTYPWIKERLDSNTLSIHSWYFDMNTGNIEVYDPKEKEFKVLS